MRLYVPYGTNETECDAFEGRRVVKGVLTMRTSNERASPGSEHDFEFSPIPSVTSPFYQQQQITHGQSSPYLIGGGSGSNNINYHHQQSPFPTLPHNQSPPGHILAPQPQQSYSLASLAYAFIANSGRGEIIRTETDGIAVCYEIIDESSASRHRIQP